MLLMFGEFKFFGDTNIMFQRQKYESMETFTKIGDNNMDDWR
jgi:hypothetical protein